MKNLFLILISSLLYSSCIVGQQSKYNDLEKAIKQSEQCKVLFLENKGLKEFPIEILRLKNLRVLSLVGNQIEYIPQEISLLQELDTIFLSKNNLKTIPISLFEIKGLVLLDVSGNNISNVPDDVCKLNNLKILNLTGNKIEYLPRCIVQSPLLRRVFIEDYDGNIHLSSSEVEFFRNQNTKVYIKGVSKAKKNRVID